MSNTVYYVRTVDRQYEIARLVAQLDQGIDSMQARMNEIDRRAQSMETIQPARILNLRDNPGPICDLSAKLDLSDVAGLVRPEASRISQELQERMQAMTITPVMIQSENNLPADVKTSLGQVRKVTLETVQSLLQGKTVEGVKIDDFRLLKQDGNVYDVEILVKVEGREEWIKSKVCLLRDGSVTIHQTHDHPAKTCDKVAKQIAATVDVALTKAYSQKLGPLKSKRSISGNVVIGNKMVSLQKSMCG